MPCARPALRRPAGPAGGGSKSRSRNWVRGALFGATASAAPGSTTFGGLQQDAEDDEGTDACVAALAPPAPSVYSNQVQRKLVEESTAADIA
jgi:hypothetical protein